ncbi:MAG: flavodoxin [Bacteroidales bacterium]|jgi:flavodoxin I|nr:flavodoxin [Bacteroidales bacterium]
MEPIGIFYGSTTGNTKKIAQKIKEHLKSETIDLYNVRDASKADLEKYNNIILGSSTWGEGELQEDFKRFLEVIKKAKLKGKKVAIFGIGDSSIYPDSFADALGVIFEALEGKGVIFVGEFSTRGYHFEKSLAIFDDKFVGLPLDDDSDEDQNRARIAIWSDLLNQKMN